MVNLLASIILIVIAFFVITLFPGGKDFVSGIKGAITEKTVNVTDEYDRVKGEAEEVKDKVVETKNQVGKAVDTVNNAMDSVGDAIDGVNEMIGRNTEEAWRTSDPEIDPSINAGRTNYNLADPGEDGMNEEHLEMDIKPWIEWGNRGDDPSTKEERIAAMAQTEKGREILEELDYEY